MDKQQMTYTLHTATGVRISRHPVKNPHKALAVARVRANRRNETIHVYRNGEFLEAVFPDDDTVRAEDRYQEQV